MERQRKLSLAHLELLWIILGAGMVLSVLGLVWEGLTGLLVGGGHRGRRRGHQMRN